MNAERWREIQALYSAVHARPDERHALLTATDPDIRSEVERMLAADVASNILDHPAPEVEGEHGTVAVGTQLGPYRIVAPIGRGGMGEVYRAHDSRMGRDVAIKISAEQFSERFSREVRAIAALSHPNVCALYDVGPNYLVMELLEGHSLQQLLKERRLSVDEAVHIAQQLSEALHAAHDKGVTHRDIKPGNVFVSPRGHVKVLDFGLAKLNPAAPRAEEPQTIAPDLSQPGVAMGTVSYMAPEQARGEEIDARADLWSLGVVLYEMLTGTRPFEGATNALVFDAIFHRQPKPCGAGLELDTLAARLLEKDRKARTLTAAEVSAELRRIERSSGTPAQVAGQTPVAQRRWMPFAAVTLIAVAAGAWWLGRPSRAPPSTEPVASATAPPASNPAPEAAKDELLPEVPKPLLSHNVTVVAEIVNKTNDPVFDSLREFLTAKMQESEVLLPMSLGQMSALLEEMKRDPRTRITPQVARELCIRAREKATLTSTISPVGKLYSMVLTVTNCLTGEVLASSAGDAAGKEQVLQALVVVLDNLRRQLGDKLPTSDKAWRPSFPITTFSLDAFQAYAAGVQEVRQGRWEAAAANYHRARDIDPKFAFAWFSEGLMLDNLRRPRSEVNPLIEKGYELRQNVSLLERLLIEARYNQFIKGDRKKARAIFEQMLQIAPRNGAALNALALEYSRIGELQRAVNLRKRQREGDPANILGYTNAINDYRLMDRFRDAHTMAEMPFIKKADPPSLHEQLLRLAYIEGDEAAVEREFQALKGSVTARQIRAAYLLSSGRFNEAAQELAALGGGVKGGPNVAGILAQVRGLAGDCRGVNGPGQPLLILLVCGEYDHAAARAEESLKQPDLTPENEALNRASLAVAQHQPEQAIALLAPLVGDEAPGANSQVLRGFVYRELKKPAEAAVEFRKLAGGRGQMLNEPYPFALVYLARALAAAGKKAEAKKAYETFLDLWKNADPGLPLREQAQREYAEVAR